VDDVFWAVRFVGLRNETAAEVELFLNGGRQLRKRADGKTADQKRGFVAFENGLAGLDKRI
jgi:hypothetical protein